jgi:ABC-type Fe3+-siderophore transport system permease subunit
MSDPTNSEGKTVALDAQWSAVARGYRNALVLAAVFGVVAVVLSLIAGRPAVGLFVCLGLAMGGYNARKLWTDTQALNPDTPSPKTAVMKTSLTRLGLITVFAFLVAALWRTNGWGIFVGLVLFQLEMMSLLIRPLRRVVAP